MFSIQLKSIVILLFLNSIMNSLVIVLFLSGMVAMIMLRTLHKDIARYNQMDSGVSHVVGNFVTNRHMTILCIIYMYM